MEESITVTAREQNNPAFRIAPFNEEMPDGTVGCLSLADDLVNEYEDTFEALAKNDNGKTQKNASSKRDQN